MQSTNNHPLLILRAALQGASEPHVTSFLPYIDQSSRPQILESWRNPSTCIVDQTKFSSKTYWIEEFSSCLDECWEFWPRPLFLFLFCFFCCCHLWPFLSPAKSQLHLVHSRYHSRVLGARAHSGGNDRFCARLKTDISAFSSGLHVSATSFQKCKARPRTTSEAGVRGRNVRF
jgi:hypothetical protein